MKLLTELHDDFEDEGSTYDRAVDMINSAVEEHNLKDEFDKIADVEGLVEFLKGRFHDFSQEIEQNVRDIIADEMGEEDDEMDYGNDEEDLAQYKDNYNKGLIPDGEEEEEFRGGGKYKGEFKGSDFRGGGKKKRSDGGRARLQNRRRKTVSRSQFDVEQEEAKDADYVDWDEEVSRFNKRQEPDRQRRRKPSSRRRFDRRSRSNTWFDTAFEGFKKFHDSHDE